MAEILLVRHGQTEWSRDKRHTGRTDVPLTAEGRRQSERLAGPLAGHSFERVLTSPLSRAAETCRLAGLGGAAEPRDELLEWDYGDYEGRTSAEIAAERPGWSLWRDGCPGGESVADVAARLEPLLAVLRALEGGGEAIVFAHGHVLRVLTALWLGLGPEHGALFVLDTATLSGLGWEHGRPALTRWNVPASG